MLSHLQLDSKDLLLELERRFGTSGLEEKAARGQQLPTGRQQED